LKVYVLDVSVAVKWFLPDESFSDEALALLRDYREAKIDFIAPDFFWPEFGNVIWKAVRRKRCSAETSAEALHQIFELKLKTVPSADLVDDALALALATGQTVYDSLYVVLAMRSDVEMITADERLVTSVGSRLPVRWLGSV